MEKTLYAIPAVLLLGYLLGSVSFALVASRLFAHDDVRKYGSHNAGATNVLRVYGPKPALFTLVGDFAKGVLAVYLGRLLFGALGIVTMDAGYIAGLGALLGHLFPLWFGFRGGKGVLTGLGIILAVNPLVFVLLLLICLPALFALRIVSLVSISGAVLYPILTYAVQTWRGQPALGDSAFALLFAVLVIWMHRSNIQRLLNGTEKRITLPGGKGKDSKGGR